MAVGVAYLGWWRRLRLFWPMWRVVEPDASVLERWRAWRRAKRQVPSVTQELEWAAWIASGPPWTVRPPDPV